MLYDSTFYSSTFRSSPKSTSFRGACVWSLMNRHESGVRMPQ